MGKYKTTKKDRLQERSQRLKAGEEKRKEKCLEMENKKNVIVVKRLSVGLMLSIDETRHLRGVRCYHTGRNGECLPCDCTKDGMVFTLSETSEALMSAGKLVIDESILHKQALDLSLGITQNRHSPLGSSVFASF